jgi:hypothetical protein
MEILLTITGLFIAIIALPWSRHEILDDLVLEAYLIYCALPALNLVTLPLTFTKEKKQTTNKGACPEQIYTELVEVVEGN